jgi:glycosyltransferase involved in cell wall biosynthesis
VIITKDRPKELSLLLKSIKKQPRLPKELIIIDDISDGDSFSLKSNWIKTCKDLEKNKVKLKYLKVKYKNPSKSRNAGLKKVKSKYVLLVDDDIVLLKNTIQLTLKTFHENNSATMVVPNFENLEKNSKNIWSEYDMFYFSGQKKSIKKIIKTSFAPSAFYCLKMEFIKENNIKFDESVNINEDHYFCNLITKNRGKILYQPSITVLHQFRTTPTQLLKRRKQFADGLVETFKNKPNAYIKDWIPERKLQIIFFPLFILLRANELAKNEIERLDISKKYLLPSIMDKLTIFVAIYQNKKIRKMALNQIKNVILK